MSFRLNREFERKIPENPNSSFLGKAKNRNHILKICKINYRLKKTSRKKEIPVEANNTQEKGHKTLNNLF